MGSRCLRSTQKIIKIRGAAERRPQESIVGFDRTCCCVLVEAPRSQQPGSRPAILQSRSCMSERQRSSRPLPIDPCHWKKFWWCYYTRFSSHGTLQDFINRVTLKHYPQEWKQLQSHVVVNSSSNVGPVQVRSALLGSMARASY